MDSGSVTATAPARNSGARIGGRQGLRFSFAALIAAMSFTTANASASEVFSFDNTFAYPVGANAKGFSAGDCDGDGVVDMVAAGQNSNEVTILRNAGGGKFEFGGGSTNVSQPTGAACLDFDGDGLVDFAAASRLGNVDLFRRNPGGDFTQVGSRPAGVAPASLTSGYLNDDQLLDLVAVSSTSEDITVIINTGSATPPFSRIAVPIKSPHAAAIADFNMDGRADIAVAGATSPYVVLLFGDGVGFAPRTDSVPSPFVQTKKPPKGQGIATGDLNGDLKPDLALLSSDGVVTLYLGTGTGTFTFLNAFTVAEDAEAISLADFNDDGLVDLALLSSGTNSAQVLYATSAGVFPVPAVSPQTEAFNAFGSASTRSVLLDPADTTSTHTQVLLADSAGHALTVAEQTQLAALSVQPLQALSDSPVAITLADMTGDGVADAIVTSKIKRLTGLQVMPANASGGYDHLALAGGGTCGNGILEPSEVCDDGNLKARDGCSKTCIVEFSKNINSLFVADINRDLKNDVVLLDDRGFVYLFIGDGQGRFSQVRFLTKTKRKTTFAVADFNGDGHPDIIIVPKNKRDGALSMLVNNGFGDLTPTPIAFRTPVTGPVLAGDFDRNGLPDLLISYKAGWTLLYNDGAGPARDAGHNVVPKGLKSFAAGDFNEDGWMDVVTTFTSAKLPALMFRGTVAGTFGGAEVLGLDAKALPPFVVDLDEDRHLDIMSCSPAATASCNVRYGNGQGQFGAAASPSVLSFGREITGAGAGDFDQDGNVDLVGISYRDHTAVVVFRGPVPLKLTLNAGQRPSDIAVVDLNGDDKLDFVVASEASRDLSIFVNLGNRQFSQPAPVRLPSVPDHSLGRIALAVGDINGDQVPDLAASQAGGTVTPLLNLNGGGLAALASLPTGARPWGVALGEMNGDGILDIVTANRDDSTFTVQLSGPGGTYTRTDYPSGGIRASDVAVADLNGDFRADVIVTNEKVEPTTALGNVVVFLNNGSGGFGPKIVHQRGRETPRSICTGDFDGDTIADVAIGSLESNDVMVLHGKGNGEWRNDELDFPVGFGAVSVNCIDADGDNRTDIAYARKKAGDVGVVLTGQ